MIAVALVLVQAASAAPLNLGVIGRQALPPSGCAAYLWRGEPEPQLVAMAVAEPGRLRLTVDGRTVDLPRTAARGDVRLGLPASGDFAGSGLSATLDLTVAEQRDLTDGARVPAGTLTVQRAGSDAVVQPVAGLIGCARQVR